MALRRQSINGRCRVETDERIELVLSTGFTLSLSVVVLEVYAAISNASESFVPKSGLEYDRRPWAVYHTERPRVCTAQ